MDKQRIWDEISVGTKLFISHIVPPRELRIPITIRTFPYILAQFPPLMLMAYSVRRPGTDMWLVRMLLLPLVVFLALKSAFAYMLVDERLNVYNWGLGLLSLVMIAKAFDYAFAPEGRLKLGERVPGEHYDPVIALSLSDSSNGQPNGNANGGYESDPLRDTSGSEPEGHPSSRHIFPAKSHQEPSSRYRGLMDSLEIMCAQRGLGWDFGATVYVPPRPPSFYHRRNFILHTIRTFLVYFTLFDFLESLLKLVPGVGSPRGGTIFLASEYLPKVPYVGETVVRYTISSVISLISGTAVMAGFMMVYALSSFIGVVLLKQDPRAWPPVFDAPFFSTSLNDFWAKRWHQFLRRTFMVYGGLPFGYIASLLPLPVPTAAKKSINQIATVLGAFLASGIFHELASVAMGRGWNGRVVWFFFMHGGLVIVERVWRKVSGRRVGGWWGMVWVYFWVAVAGQFCINAWHMKGLAGGLIVPPIFSPTRRVIFPLVERLTGWRLDTLQY